MIPFLVLFMVFETIDSQSLYFCDTNGKDVCEVANTKQPFQPNARYPHCPYNGDRPYCDRYITPGWYRYSSTMLTVCPSLGFCGAIYPYWLNGSHPTSVNQEVTRTVCKTGFSNCCDKQVTIKIRHCGEFMAYCLPALDACSERYCLDGSGECEPTTTVSVQSTTKTSSAIQTTVMSSSSTYPTTQMTSQQTTLSTENSRLSTDFPKSTDFSSTSRSSTSFMNSIISSTRLTASASNNANPTTSLSTTSKLTTANPADRSTVKTTENSDLFTTPSVFDHCSNGIDPCDARNQIENVPNQLNRSYQCIYESILNPCDRDLEMKWYKGFKILDRCPRFLTCGAVYPVWMNGTEPEVRDGVVTRDACKVGPNNCCEEKLEIKVVNCNLYTAYCLRPLRRCEERYCFDTKTCSTKSPLQERNTSTENSLSMSSIVIIAIITVIGFLLIIVSVIIYMKRCRNNSDSLYEKPLASPSENEYEMPTTSHINHGNVYDELPEMHEGTEEGSIVQTSPDDSQYDYIPERTSSSRNKMTIDKKVVY